MNVRLNNSHHESRAIIVSDGTNVKELIPMALPQPEAGSSRQLAMQAFEQAFEAVVLFFPYTTKWENGTGYFDGVVKDKELNKILKIGDTTKFVSPGNRRGIILHTRYGNLAVFDRYADRSGIFVANMPSQVRRALRRIDEDFSDTSPWSAKQIHCVFDNPLDFLAKVDTLQVQQELTA